MLCIERVRFCCLLIEKVTSQRDNDVPEADGAAGAPLVDGSQLAADGTVTPLASASHDGAETLAGASASQEKPEAEAAQL